MRHVILIAIFGLLSTSIVGQFELGAYVGFNSNKLSGDNPKEFRYQPRLGMTLGVIGHYYIKPDVRISFQPGYAFNRPDAQYTDRELDETRDTARFTLDYIKLPVYLDILSNNRKWHFVAGLDVQIGVNQMVTLAGEEAKDFSDQVNSVNPVIYFGLGRRIQLASNMMSIDLRFGQGILNLSNNRDDVTSLIPRIKTVVVELLVSYEFKNGNTQTP